MTGWAGRFEVELMRLGPQPARARQLTEETTQQAAECATEPDPGPPPTTGRVLPRLAGVSKRYRRRTVLTGVDLTVRGGEVAFGAAAASSRRSCRASWRARAPC